MTKEETYRRQMKELGTYEEIFEPEIRTLSQLEREYTAAKKAWSKTAPPGGKPSVLDDHYSVLLRMRAEILQHRDALGLTPKSLRRLRGVNTEGPDQRDLITAKLDKIAESVSGGENIDLGKLLAARDAFSGMPGFEEAVAIGDQMDAEDYDLKKAVAEDMG